MCSSKIDDNINKYVKYNSYRFYDYSSRIGSSNYSIIYCYCYASILYLYIVKLLLLKVVIIKNTICQSNSKDKSMLVES